MIVLGIYRHYKGNEYRVLHLAKDEESGAPVVVYQAMDGVGQIWVRSAAVFEEAVMINGALRPRFELVRLLDD